MTDLEMTKLCAEAMGLEVVEQLGGLRFPNTPLESSLYDPLHDDAQAMALVKRFNLSLNIPEKPHACEAVWFDPHSDNEIRAFNHDLNRAIVECVAKMQAERSK